MFFSNLSYQSGSLSVGFVTSLVFTKHSSDYPKDKKRHEARWPKLAEIIFEKNVQHFHRKKANGVFVCYIHNKKRGGLFVRVMELA